MVPLVAFDFLLFILALMAYAKHVKEHHAVGFTGRKPLMTLLLQDSILFLLMYACSLGLTLGLSSIHVGHIYSTVTMYDGIFNTSSEFFHLTILSTTGQQTT